MIPLFKVFMAPDVEDHVIPVLKSGYVGEGAVSKQFEQAFGEYIGTQSVALVNSGTSAITMALRLAGVGPGTSVVTTPMTCLATNMPILSLGATPVWADILADGTIDPEDAKRKLRPDTKAILCMDWGGTPCKMAELLSVASSANALLIADACQSLGAEYDGDMVGHQADLTCYSFQAIKYLTSVDGGALAAPWHPQWVESSRLMRWFGLDRTKSAMLRCGQDPPVWGYKFQSNDVLASIGLANLMHLPRLIKAAQRNAQAYDEAFEGLTAVKLPPRDAKRKSARWAYTLFVDDVPAFVAHCKNAGIMASKVHERNDTKTVFRESAAGPLPGADYFDSHYVCIPVGWWLMPGDVQHIIRTVADWKG